MDLVLDILKWSGIAAAGIALAGMFFVGAMVWMLNHPVDDDAEESAGRC